LDFELIGLQEKIMRFFEDYYQELTGLVGSLDERSASIIAEQIIEVNRSGGKVLVFGNGGSAAIASHVVVDLNKAAGMRAICFSDSAMLTCFANDYGYDQAYMQMFLQHAEINDLAIIISSSGESSNVLKLAQAAREMQCQVVTFSGFDPENKLRAIGDVNFYCHSSKYNMVENVHQIWLLSIVDYLISLKEKA
jgi:D-sedoheptulose 7-phosphate isomerase